MYKSQLNISVRDRQRYDASPFYEAYSLRQCTTSVDISMIFLYNASSVLCIAQSDTCATNTGTAIGEKSFQITISGCFEHKLQGLSCQLHGLLLLCLSLTLPKVGFVRNTYLSSNKGNQVTLSAVFAKSGEARCGHVDISFVTNYSTIADLNSNSIQFRGSRTAFYSLRPVEVLFSQTVTGLVPNVDMRRIINSLDLEAPVTSLTLRVQVSIS